MNDATIVLSSDCDDLLASVVHQVVAGVQRLRLERVSGTEAVLRRLEDDNVKLLLAYHAGPQVDKDIGKLMKAACGQSIPTIVLSDETIRSRGFDS